MKNPRRPSGTGGPKGEVSLRVPELLLQATANRASQAEQARAEQQHAAGLRHGADRHINRRVLVVGRASGDVRGARAVVPDDTAGVEDRLGTEISQYHRTTGEQPAGPREHQIDGGTVGWDYVVRGRPDSLHEGGPPGRSENPA